MSDRIALADISDQHLEKRLRVFSDATGTLSGDLGMFVHLPDDLVMIALWRGDRCVQDIYPSSTECEVLP